MVGVFPHDDRVRLLFEHGRELPDPDGILEGDAKQVRWVTVRVLTPALRPRPEALVELAVERRLSS